MFRSLAISVAALSLAASLHAADSMHVDSLVLSLGQTPEEVEEQLGPGLQLVWERDLWNRNIAAFGEGGSNRIESPRGVIHSRTVTVGERTINFQYAEESGEHARIIRAGDPANVVAFLVFEESRLTRARRLIADFSSASAPDAIAAISAVLASWDSHGAAEVTVESSVYLEQRTPVREIVFRSGERKLTLLDAGGPVQLVENLGRGDIPSIGTSVQ